MQLTESQPQTLTPTLKHRTDGPNARLPVLGVSWGPVEYVDSSLDGLVPEVVRN